MKASRRPELLASAALAAWAVLVIFNAWPGLRPDPVWVWRFFVPTLGTWRWAGFMAAQRRHIVAFVALVIFDVIALAVGRRVLQWLASRPVPRMVGFAAALLGGAAGLGMAAVGVAFVGLAFPGVFAGLGAALLWPAVRPGALRGWITPRPRWPDALAWPALVVAGLAALVAVIGALAPETADDALRIIVELPRTTLLRHRLIPEPHLPLTWTPWLPEGQALPLMALAGETPVRLLSVQASLVVAALVAGWAGSLWPAAAWLVLLPVPLLAQNAMADLTTVAWAALAAATQFRLRRPGLAGLGWGIAIGMKYQAALFAGPALLVEGWSDRRGAVRLAAVAIAAALLWPVRSWLMCGHATAPFLMAWGNGLPVRLSPAFFGLNSWIGQLSAGAVLRSPWTLVTHQTIMDTLLSPVLVILLPCAIVLGSPGRLHTFAATALAVWAIVAGNDARYLLPAAPALLVTAWLSLSRLAPGPAGRRRAAMVASVMLLIELSASIHRSFFLANPMPVVLGRETPEAYLERTMLPRPAAWHARQAFAPWLARSDARYLVNGLVQAHAWGGLPWLPAELMPSPLADLAATSSDERRLGLRLRQRGLRWLLDDETAATVFPGLQPDAAAWTPRATALYRSYWLSHARPVGRMSLGGAVISLYEIDRHFEGPALYRGRLPGVSW